MKLLHTGDWHIGRIFHGLHLTEDQSYLLDQFADIVRDVRPHAVLIAGDIYDRSVPPEEAVSLLNDWLSRVVIGEKVPVVLISGNHDSAARLGFGSKLLVDRGLHVFWDLKQLDEPLVLEDEYGKVSLHGFPYSDPPQVRQWLDVPSPDHQRAMEALVARTLASPIASASRRVAIAHAFVSGGSESESERPLAIGGSGCVEASVFQPFHYTALGHLHRTQRLGGDKGWVQYSGSLYNYSFSEIGQRKSVTLIELDARGGVRTEQIPLSPRRALRRIEGDLEQILRDGPNDSAKNDYLVIALQDRGALLDPMGKLRQIYPNVLHLERPGLKPLANAMKDVASIREGREKLALSETELFESFFRQVTGEAMSRPELEIFAEMLGLPIAPGRERGQPMATEPETPAATQPAFENLPEPTPSENLSFSFSDPSPEVSPKVSP